jgi:hypothetical protein
MRQTDKMREPMDTALSRNEAIKEYVAAEQRGELVRESNVRRVPPESYAAYLCTYIRRKDNERPSRRVSRPG